MGIFGTIFGAIFGGGRNVVTETVEVFRENAEKGAQRSHDYDTAALAQYAAEFHARSNRTIFDALADALNRLVRPVVTLCLLYPLFLGPTFPDYIAKVLEIWAKLPEYYWGLLALVIPFYFGGRMQVKRMEAKQAVASAAALRSLSGEWQQAAPDVAEGGDGRAASVGLVPGGGEAAPGAAQPLVERIERGGFQAG